MFLADKYSSEKQKKNIVFEYYDTSDPFIDDSELAIDERQFFAQTKQQGFYVSSEKERSSTSQGQVRSAYYLHRS